VSALKSWIPCVDGCIICVELPEELRALDNSRKLYVALYITARKILDYRVAAAMRIYILLVVKLQVEPKLLVKVFSNVKVVSRIPQAIED